MRVAILLTVMACVGCAGAAADREVDDGRRTAEPVAVQRVVAELAERLDVEVSALRVTARAEVTWPSAALGCPDPGKMYAQATTPGWRLTVVGPEDASRHVHSNTDGSLWVVCEGGRPVAPGRR